MQQCHEWYVNCLMKLSCSVQNSESIWQLAKNYEQTRFFQIDVEDFFSQRYLILQQPGIISPGKLANSWWRHQMETFSALLALCAGNSLVTGEFSSQRPVTRSFDVFFDLRLNKRLSKQSWGWWLETLSCPSWRHCNGQGIYVCVFVCVCLCMYFDRTSEQNRIYIDTILFHTWHTCRASKSGKYLWMPSRYECILNIIAHNFMVVHLDLNM